MHLTVLTVDTVRGLDRQVLQNLGAVLNQMSLDQLDCFGTGLFWRQVGWGEDHGSGKLHNGAAKRAPLTGKQNQEPAGP